MANRTGVNWGRGRLKKYESFYSIVAKFAALNGLRPTRAWKFLSKRLGLSHPGAFLETHNQITALAKLLDEPVNVVRTLRSDQHDLSRWANQIFDSSGLGQPMSELRYCRECVRAEFHAFFHQFRYLSFCPIHQIRLQRETSRFFNLGNTRFENNVLLMADIFRRHNSYWPTSPGEKFDFQERSEVQKTVKSYIYWSRDVCERLEDAGNRMMWQSIGRVAMGLRKDDGAPSALAAITAYFGAPSIVLNLLSEQPPMVMPKRVFPVATAKAIEAIVERDAFSIVLDVYRCWWAWSKRATIYEEKLKDFLDRLRANHATCDCRRVWTFSTGWVRRPPGGKKYRQECAHDLAMRCIGRRWGDLSWVPEEHKMSELEHYRYYIDRLESMKLIGVKRSGNAAECLWDPVGNVHLTWHFPHDVIELLETLVSTELEMKVEVWMNWLNWVTNGLDPDEYHDIPQYSALFRLEEGLELVRWKGVGHDPEPPADVPPLVEAEGACGSGKVM